MINTEILARIEAQTTQRLPQKEAEWCGERKRIEEYELAYKRAVFQVENRQCLLLEALMAGTLPLEVGTTRLALLLLVYRMSNEAYMALIEQYLFHATEIAPKPLAESIQQSQHDWWAYRQQMNGVWESIYAGIQQAQWLVGTSQKRLEEVFQLYHHLKTQ